MPKYFKIMLGEKSKYADECFIEGFFGVWYDIENDLTTSLSCTWDAFKKKYTPVLSEKNRWSASCLQLWKVCNEIEIGDIILCPDSNQAKSFYIGEVWIPCLLLISFRR